MLEAKFDTMLALLRARGAGEEEIKDGVTGGGGTSGTGAIVPVAFNKGGGGRSPLGFLGKYFAGKIIRANELKDLNAGTPHDWEDLEKYKKIRSEKNE